MGCARRARSPRARSRARAVETVEEGGELLRGGVERVGRDAAATSVNRASQSGGRPQGRAPGRAWARPPARAAYPAPLGQVGRGTPGPSRRRSLGVAGEEEPPGAQLPEEDAGGVDVGAHVG